RGHQGPLRRRTQPPAALVVGGVARPRFYVSRALLQSSGRRAARHPRSASAHMTGPLLSVEDLHVTFSTRGGLVEAVRGITLQLAAGGMLGLLGGGRSRQAGTGL